jgi:imidazolonepropionase-like amidohydrolase
VDDRRGTYPKMTPEVYNAVIDEAHKQHMMVHAHAIALADQKAVVRAGADVLVHTVANEKLDDELLALLKEKKPYWTTVIGLGDRSEACNSDPFVDQTYPARARAAIRESSCGPAPATAAAREAMLANNVPKMVAAGARLVLGTDAGITARHAFGWADHHEIARWVDLGLTPAQAIAAATGGRALGIRTRERWRWEERRLHRLTAIHWRTFATRDITSVYLRGAMLNRTLVSGWKKTNPSR